MPKGMSNIFPQEYSNYDFSVALSGEIVVLAACTSLCYTSSQQGTPLCWLIGLYTARLAHAPELPVSRRGDHKTMRAHVLCGVSKCLVRADESAMGAINRALQRSHFICYMPILIIS